MAPTVRSLGNARLNMLNKPRALTTRPEFVADIHREWSNALEATVAVGRRLNEAKVALPHGEYEAMVESDLPFSSATARKLRKAAELVDSGQIDLEKLPESYTTLYAIATLPDEARQQAIDQGVIRPDVTRAELEAFRAPKPADPVKEQRREGLRADLADLFAGPAALPAPTPAVPSTPPTVIDVEAVPVPSDQRNVMFLEGAIDRPWSVDPNDRCSILAHMDRSKRVALMGIHPDDATAAIVQYVVDLHNARLMKG